jgi:GntR family transcriptional regulator/MocR family aminotransferase
MSIAPVAELIAQELTASDDARLPMHRRVYESLRGAILSQRLKAGDRLPSTRDLATDLGVSRNTVMAAFQQLIAEGYVDASIGSGTYVAQALASPRQMIAAGRASRAPRSALVGKPLHAAAVLSRRGGAIVGMPGDAHYEVQPFVTSTEDYAVFPFKVWQRLQNRHWRASNTDLLDYSKGGCKALVDAIADYLRISRSVNVSPEQVLITSGTQQSIDLCARLLADVGDTVWVENPCYWAARKVFEINGLKLQPVAVDDEGLAPNAADLAATPKLVYVTPSHQYPSGVVMSLARRRQLLDMAAQTGAWILEDDYDAEFRYEGRPLASLQGLDTHDRVVYMGTFSKVMYPGLRIGYLVVPPALVESFRTGMYDLQRPGQLMTQAALADFISMGYFANHLRKQRQLYGTRRKLLVNALRSILGPLAVLTPHETGIHLVLYLPDEVDDVAIARRCANEQLSLRPLSTYFLAPPVKKGLVIGYAYVPTDAVSLGGRKLARLILEILAPGRVPNESHRKVIKSKLG